MLDTHWYVAVAGVSSRTDRLLLFNLNSAFEGRGNMDEAPDRRKPISMKISASLWTRG